MHKILTVWASLAILAIHTAAAAAPKYGPKAQPLSAKTNLAYFQKNPAADYWALSPYYVPQETSRGCSAATMAMILNGARAGTPLNSDQPLITFKTLLEKYTDQTYRDAILSTTPYIPGMTRHQHFSNLNITRLLNGAAEKLQLPGVQWQATQHIIDEKDPKKSRDEFLTALQKNEKSSKDFIFFSFTQGELTGDPEGRAHVATVGAYDAKKKLVLVMDPDREWYEPYWVKADDLFVSMTDPKSDSRGEPGWIYFESKPVKPAPLK